MLPRSPIWDNNPSIDDSLKPRSTVVHRLRAMMNSLYHPVSAVLDEHAIRAEQRQFETDMKRGLNAWLLSFSDEKEKEQDELAVIRQSIADTASVTEFSITANEREGDQWQSVTLKATVEFVQPRSDRKIQMNLQLARPWRDHALNAMIDRPRGLNCFLTQYHRSGPVRDVDCGFFTGFCEESPIITTRFMRIQTYGRVFRTVIDEKAKATAMEGKESKVVAVLDTSEAVEKANVILCLGEQLRIGCGRHSNPTPSFFQQHPLFARGAFLSGKIRASDVKWSYDEARGFGDAWQQFDLAALQKCMDELELPMDAQHCQLLSVLGNFQIFGPAWPRILATTTPALVVSDQTDTLFRPLVSYFNGEFSRLVWLPAGLRRIILGYCVHSEIAAATRKANTPEARKATAKKKKAEAKKAKMKGKGKGKR